MHGKHITETIFPSSTSQKNRSNIWGFFLILFISKHKEIKGIRAVSTIFNATEVNSKLWELLFNLWDLSEHSYGQNAAWYDLDLWITSQIINQNQSVPWEKQSKTRHSQKWLYFINILLFQTTFSYSQFKQTKCIVFPFFEGNPYSWYFCCSFLRLYHTSPEARIPYFSLT